MSKRWTIFFVSAFLLNLAWEHAHAGLYIPRITVLSESWLYFVAAVVDALLVTIGAMTTLFRKKSRMGFFVVLTFVIAALIERAALTAGWWEYRAAMPIVPIMRVGVSPLAQLVTTGIIAHFFSARFSQKSEMR